MSIRVKSCPSVEQKDTPGTQRIEFTIREIKEVAASLGIELGNAADVIYRMRSRTRLPDDILDLGFTIIRNIGRGRYALEVGGEAVSRSPSTTCTTTTIKRRSPSDGYCPKTLPRLTSKACSR